MESKFTKGKWIIDGDAIINKDGKIILLGVGLYANGEENEANLNLAKSAPQLLDALQLFTEDFDRGYTVMTPNMIKQAKAAITSALGTKGGDGE